MNVKKLLMVFILFLAAFFGMTGGTSAESQNVLKIDFSTDKPSYKPADEVTSTITITNQSERNHAKNLDIQTSIPDELEVISEDVKVSNGKVKWDVDKLESGKAATISFKTKLKETNDGKEEDDGAAVVPPKEKEASDGKEKDESAVVAPPKGPGKNDDANSPGNSIVAPQTGDNSSIVKYVVLFIISLLAGVFAFILIRKKKLAGTLPFVLAILMSYPALSHVQAEDNQQTVTKKHHITIGNKAYELETTVVAAIQEGQVAQDEQVEIPVTGTAYDSKGVLLTNKQLKFSATIDGKVVEETAKSDNEGYFIVRLVKDVAYEAKGDGLHAKIQAKDLNEIQITNQTGEIKLGKTLVNGNNRSSLQPSAIYLPDDITSKITAISSDLSKATISGQVDLKANDFIVIPKWKGFPSGVAFQIKSVKVENGGVTLNLVQPQIEDIFVEIIGNLNAEMTPARFVPADGVSMDQSTARLGNFGPQYASLTAAPAVSLGSKVTLNLGNLYKVKGFSLKGSVDLSGQVTGDIEWRLGLNPVQAFDMNFQGEQRLNIDVETSVTKKFPDVPLGKFIVPTEIPGLAVSVPFDLVSSASGKVGVKISYGIRENIGLAYERGSGMRTYPEEHISPYFSTSDVNGSGSISSGVRMSVLAQALGIDLAGAASTGSVTGTATTSMIGNEHPFKCISVSGSFDGKLNLRAPIAKWESSGSINFSKVFASTKIGDCVKAIKINPNEIELAPGQTKSVTVIATDNVKQTPINNDDKLRFEVSNNHVNVQKSPTRVDIKASESAQDGEVIKIKGVYGSNDTSITDTLTVRIVDDRQKGELVGQVVDAVEEVPLNEASINVYHDNRLITTVQTVQDGTYKAKLAPGSYKVEVSHSGYITDTSIVNITSANSTTYDSKLQLVGNEYAGNGTVSGQITNAVNGRGVSGATIEIRKGKNTTTGEIVQTLTTNESGYYETELSGGNYTMSLSAGGYIPSEANILAIGGKATKNQNGTLSPDGLIDENLRIVLTWGENPRDLDSHLTGPKAGNGRFHIYYSNKAYKDEFNDVNLDRDDVTSYGPETVTVINRMQMGTYTYSIHNYTGRYLNEANQLELANSGAKVQIYRANTLLATYNVPVNQAGNSWRVFEIRDGEIVPINKVETISSWRSADSFAPIGQ